MAQHHVFTLTATCSSTASTTEVGATANGLLRFDWFTVDANIQGASGGTLDVYLQRQIEADLWADWLHFPQLTDGQAATQYCAQSGSDKTIHAVEQGTDGSAGTPVLAANTFIGGHPGNAVRLVTKTGAGVGTGTSQTVKITGWQNSS